MLDDAYFVTLDGYPGERLKRLPLWAARYERSLRKLASWWHEAKRGRPGFAAPVIQRPTSARFNSLPVWAQEWLNTLAWEVTWHRDKLRPPEPKPFELLRIRGVVRERSLFSTSPQ